MTDGRPQDRDAETLNALRDDESAIRDLVNSYALSFDACDEDNYRSLWAHGARLTMHFGESERTLQFSFPDTPPPIAADHKRWVRTLHLMHNHVVRVEGDSATGVSYGVAHHIGKAPDSTLVDNAMYIRYEDQYRRGDDGDWRFWRRDGYILWSAVHGATAPIEPA